MKRKPKRKPPARPEPDGFERWQDSLTQHERRVDDIVQKMQSGAWLTGVSERALAKEWRCAPDTVRKAAAEASRVVRRYIRDTPEAQLEVRAQVVQTMEVIRAKAMLKGDPASLRVALDATRALGFYLGVEPAQKLDIGRREPEFQGWTPQEKLAFAESGARPRRALRQAATIETDGNGVDVVADGNVH